MSWFVALPVSPGTWYAALPPPPAGARPLAADDLHLTVAFLGRVSPASARSAFETLADCALAPFQARLGPVVAMGPARRPSALSARAEGVDDRGRRLAEVLVGPRDASLAIARWSR